MAELTEEQKKGLEIAKKAWSEISNAYGVDIAKWAFNRKLNFEREETRLLKEKSKLEKRLSEINLELV